ncbi:hypothetical protein GGD40_004736 [Paraburkholderia bryophila]|uniref:PAAR motif-containing protein n=1 Tax=Paraburkholderia bryophila TaxID=420952 RepID=A0A7Y9WQ84_9BURK|nr:hypothetical protein [Paraburkholderia bryophila]
MIRIGDKTTNGTMLAPSTTLGPDDRQIAYEGNDAMCPAYHSAGMIQCDGPRVMAAGLDSRRVALSNDLCICCQTRA